MGRFCARIFIENRKVSDGFIPISIFGDASKTLIPFLNNQIVDRTLILAFQETFGNSHSFGGTAIDPVSALNVAYIYFDEIMDMQFDGDEPRIPSVPNRIC